MSDGGNQYDLKLGLDTGPAKPGVEQLSGDLKKLGDGADKTQAKLGTVATAAAKVSSVAGGASSSVASVASSHDKLTTASGKAGESIAKASGALGGLSVASKGAGEGLAHAREKAEGLEGSFTDLIKSALLAGVAILSLEGAKKGLEALYDTAKEVDAQLAQIRRTSNLSEADILSLYKEVEELGASRLAVPVKDLEDLAGAAGELGVTGVENIKRYVEVVGALSQVTNLGGRQAAEILTKILNVTGEGPEKIEQLGNVLVRLKSQSAGTASQIAEASLAVAQSTEEFHLGSTQAVAYGTALAELGQRAKTGGQTIGTVMKGMQDAVLNNTAASGMALQNFAKITGLTTGQFRAEFAKAPAEVFNLFLKGLAGYGDRATIALERVGLGGAGAAKILVPLGERYQRLIELQKLADDEANTNTALWTKLSQATGSLTGDLTKLENAWEIQKNSMSGGMTPALREIVQELTALVSGSDEASREFGEKLGSAVKFVGGVIGLLVRNFELLKAVLLAVIAVKAAVLFVELATSIMRGVAALLTYIGSASVATAITAGLGEEVARTSVILDMYGKNIVTTTVETDAATASSVSFLSLGITPLAVGLGGIVAVLLLVNSALTEFSENAQKDIERMVHGANDATAIIAKFRAQTEELTSATAMEAAVQEEMLRVGAKAGSPQEAQIRAQKEQEFQSRRVDGIKAQTKALDEATAAQKRLRDELAALQKAGPDSVTIDDSKMGPGAAAAAREEAFKSKIDDTKDALVDQGRVVVALTATVSKMNAATNAYEPPTVKVKGTNDLLTQQMAAWQKLSDNLQNQVTDQHALAGAYSLSGEALQQALDKLAVDKQMHSADKEMLLQHGAALRSFYEQIVTGEREVKVAQAGHQADLALRQQQAAGLAAVADATQNVTLNSKLMAAQLQVEAAMDSIGIGVADHRTKELVAEARARVLAGEEITRTTLSLQAERAFQVQVKQALAANTDERNRNTNASRAQAIAEKVTAAQVGANVTATGFLGQVIAAAVRIKETYLASLAREKVAQQQVNQFLDAYRAQLAQTADERTKIDLTRQYGDAVAQIAISLGGASGAERQLAIDEGVRIEVAAEGAAADEAAIRKRITSQQEALNQMKDQLALAQATANIWKPLQDGAAQVTQLWWSTLNTILEGGKVTFEDLGKSVLDIMLKAFEQVFENWVATTAAMSAVKVTANVAADGGSAAGGVIGTAAGAAGSAALDASAVSLTAAGVGLSAAATALFAAAGVQDTAATTATTVLSSAALDQAASASVAAAALAGAAGTSAAALSAAAGGLGVAAGALDTAAIALNTSAATSATSSVVSGGVNAATTAGAGAVTAGGGVAAGTTAAGGGGSVLMGWLAAIPVWGWIALAVIAIVTVASNWVGSHSSTRAQADLSLKNGQFVLDNLKGAKEKTGQLADVVNTIGGQLNAYILGLGAVVDNLNTQIGITRSGRNKSNEFRVYVTDEFGTKIVKNFYRDADAAMQDAFYEALAHSDLSTKPGVMAMDPMVLAAVKGAAQRAADQMVAGITDAGKKAVQQAFEGAIADAKEVSTLGQPQFVATVRQGIDHFDQLRQTMAAVLPASQNLINALGNINAAEVQMWQSERDQLTGTQQTRAQQLATAQQNAKIFNAELALRILNVKMQIAELETERAGLIGKSVAIRATADYTKTFVGSVGLMAQGVADFANVTSAAAGVMGATTQAQYDLLTQQITLLNDLASALEALPPIDPSEVRLPSAGGGNAAASAKQSFIDQLNKDIEASLPGPVQAIVDLNLALADMAKQAKELHVSEALVAQARQALIDQAKKQLLSGITQWLGPNAKDPRTGASLGGTFGMSDYQKGNADIQKQFDDLRAANEKLIKDTGQSAVAFWQLNLAEVRALHAAAMALIASFNLPLEQTRQQAADYLQHLADLNTAYQTGAIDTETYTRVTKELQDQMTAGLLGMLQGLIGQTGDAEEAAKIKAEADEANWELQLAQANLLYQTLLAAGAITPAMKATLDDFFNYVNDPAHRPDFTVKPVTTTSSSSSGTDPFAAAASLLQTIQTQIADWTKPLGQFLGQAIDLKAKLADLQAQAAATGVASGSLTGALAQLQSAYGVAVSRLVTDALAQFDRTPAVVKQAQDLISKLDDVKAAFLALGVSAADMARYDQTRAATIQGFVDDSLKAYSDLGKNPLVVQLANLRTTFSQLHDAFVAIGASSSQMAQLDQARMAALADFWKQATTGIQSVIDSLKAEDPRVSSQQKFLDARTNFRELLAKAQGGDLDALSKLQAAATAYSDAGKSFLGSGVGSGALIDEIRNALQGLVDAGPGAALAASDPVVTQLGHTNDLLTQIRDWSALSANLSAGKTGLAAPGGDGSIARLPSDTGPAKGSPPSPAASGWIAEGDRRGGGADGAAVRDLAAAIQRLAEMEKKKADAAAAAEARRRAEHGQEQSGRGDAQKTMEALIVAINELRRVLENRSPAGQS